MGSLNKVMLIGRLGSDPEKKVTQSGSSVCSFSLATTESYKDQQGKKQEKTEWHRIVLWNRLADLAEQYLAKGKQVYIEGSLGTNEWTDKDGNKRSTTEIKGQTLQFLESKDGQANKTKTSRNQSNYSQRPKPYEHKNEAPMGVDDEFMEDDIPF